MAHEIVRRLVNGIWRTVDIEAESGSGGSQTVLRTVTTLTDAQIRGLPSTPAPGVEVVAPVGSGKVAIFLQAALQTVGFWAHPYTNIDPDGLIVFRQGTVGISSDIFNMSAPLKQYLTGFLDQSGAGDPASAADVTFLLPTFIYDNDWGGAVPYAVSSSQTENAGFYLGMNSGVGDLTGGDVGNSLTVTTVYALIDLA